MKNIRPIRGAQEPPLPNNAMPECICVPKVYDWVLVSEDIGNFTFTVPAGAGCPTTPTVTVTCATSLSPNTPLCTGESNATLEIVSIRPANIDGANVKVVTMNVIFDIDITISGGGATCTLTGQTVSFKEQLVLCFPDTFDESNLRGRILTLVCDLVDFTPPVGTTDGSITLELVICKEVQVQAEVKLEVEAKFCQPRPPIPTPPLALCPPINFPQQCDIFPIPNCECQAFISADCSGPVTTTGAICTAAGTVNGFTYVTAPASPASFTQSIVASICSNCSPQNTNITYVYTDTDATDPNQSFTFRAQGATTVTCTPTAGVITLIVATGQGTITLANGTVINNVNYTLTLDTIEGMTLLLTDVTTATSFTARSLIGPDDTLTITDCTTLG
jgi:hypothetical protein